MDSSDYRGIYCLTHPLPYPARGSWRSNSAWDGGDEEKERKNKRIKE